MILNDTRVLRGKHGWSAKAVAVTVLLVCAAPSAARARQPGPEHEGLGGDLIDTLYADVSRQLERHRRGGRWRSSDSGILAWSCGQQLAALVDIYQATGERKWLDQLVEYADAMFANLTPNRDGFLSWRSRGYSLVPIHLRAAEGNRSAARIEPSELLIRQTTWMRRLVGPELRAAKPARTSWNYELIWREGNKFELRRPDGTMAQLVAVDAAGRFEPLQLVKLRLVGEPVAGDRFVLTVELPKDFDSAVHDGVILTPICRFIALVRDDMDLSTAYGNKAERYLKVIERDLVPKWDKYWRDWGDGGLLVAPNDPSLAYPGISLPHNQYLAFGNVLVLLHRITGKNQYRKRAAKMARFFKSCLRLNDDHYEWNYWDPTGPWDDRWNKPEDIRPEDTGHGSLDISFAIDAADAGIVFDQTDLKRFANTFLKVMWNGSLEEPQVGGCVTTSRPTRQSGNVSDWLRLTRLEPRILQVCSRIIPQSGNLKAKAQLLRLLAVERRQRRQRSPLPAQPNSGNQR